VGWKALPAEEDPFDAERPRLSVVEGAERGRGVKRFFSQLGVRWIAVLVALAVGAVLLASQLVR
jgi:hypothetical protein